MENQSSSSSSSSSMKMQFLLLEQVQFLKVKDDTLLQWELVDVVDAEEEEEEHEEWEQGGDEGDDNIDGFGCWESSSNSSPNEDPVEGIGHFLPHLVGAYVDDHGGDDLHVDDADGYDGHVNDDDDDGGDDDGYDLDDELVPWDVGNKFGRQRMRKLGKRAFSKMHNSKRNPYLFTRPGCVRGKHGLGLKHTY